MAEKLYRFTFKKRDLGKWEARKSTSIKYNGVEVGLLIECDDWQWKIEIQIPASEAALARNPNCPWMWGKVKGRFKTEDAARLWLQSQRVDLVPQLFIRT